MAKLLPRGRSIDIYRDLSDLFGRSFPLLFKSKLWVKMGQHAIDLAWAFVDLDVRGSWPTTPNIGILTNPEELRTLSNSDERQFNDALRKLIAMGLIQQIDGIHNPYNGNSFSLYLLIPLSEKYLEGVLQKDD